MPRLWGVHPHLTSPVEGEGFWEMQKAFLIVFGHFTLGETTNIANKGNVVLL
ncbi:unnamed protein product [marine sediment metagenome]|uniref:Uncharacterized protein n=1 Tax=marine sediment metagenome TaxID=412755 RepID=X1LLY9_9ZZZZ